MSTGPTPPLPTKLLIQEWGVKAANEDSACIIENKKSRKPDTGPNNKKKKNTSPTPHPTKLLIQEWERKAAKILCASLKQIILEGFHAAPSNK